jgi:hypothetical protein
VRHAKLGLWRSRSSDYFDFKFDSAHSAAVLDCYPHDDVLMTPASPVRELTARRPDWKLIYRDSQGIVVRARRLGRGAP